MILQYLCLTNQEHWGGIFKGKKKKKKEQQQQRTKRKMEDIKKEEQEQETTITIQNLSLEPPSPIKTTQQQPLNMSKVYKLVKSRRSALEKGIETVIWLRENHQAGRFKDIDSHYIWSAHYVLLSQNAVICHETALLGNLVEAHKEDVGLYNLLTSDDAFYRAYREFITEANSEEGGYVKELMKYKTCGLFE